MDEFSKTLLADNGIKFYAAFNGHTGKIILTLESDDVLEGRAEVYINGEQVFA